MGGFRKLTEAEILWSEEVIKTRLKDGAISPHLVEKLGLCQEYEQKFGRKIKPAGMRQRLYKMMHPEKYGSGKGRGRMDLDAFKKAKYILYSEGHIWGFDTVEQVKEMISKTGGMVEFHLFERKPLSVKIEISIE